MAIKVLVAVTDHDWFQTLRQLPDLTEANFWGPSTQGFRALRKGEILLFKLHAPYNKIVGGGIFSHASVMPCSLAWEAFGEANGAKSLEEMRRRIVKYHRPGFNNMSDFRIGCRVLGQTFFFDETEWIDPPSDWSRSIVRFKGYSTADAAGLSLWTAIQDRLMGRTMDQAIETAMRYGAPTLVTPRLGQGGFRFVVTDIYGGRCAVTRERTLPALEAAHILPYSMGGEHEASNGLLLRRDIHSLFDAGYATVTPSLSFQVSAAIREEFENGRDYYALHGTQIRVPEELTQQPNPEALAWHNENVFKG